MPPTENIEYIGDGVYAEYSAGDILLRVGDHRNEPVVTLEPEVYEKLVEFVDRASI